MQSQICIIPRPPDLAILSGKVVVPLLFELHFSFRSLLLLSQTHEAMSEKSFCQLSSFQPHMLYATYYFPSRQEGVGGQWTLGEHECGYVPWGRGQAHAGRISV